MKRLFITPVSLAAAIVAAALCGCDRSHSTPPKTELPPLKVQTIQIGRAHV
jgi:hypothetical protein